MKTIPSKETQQKMFDFFMRTSAPRLVKKANEEREALERAEREGELSHGSTS